MMSIVVVQTTVEMNGVITDAVAVERNQKDIKKIELSEKR